MVRTEFFLNADSLTAPEEASIRDFADSLGPRKFRGMIHALIESLSTGGDSTLTVESPWADPHED